VNDVGEEFTTYAAGLSRRARMPKLNGDQLFSHHIPLPPLDVQRRIVAEIEAERTLVEANRELIARMESKIQARLAEVWGGSGDAA
jgi:type I restriction enzyme M protein